MNWIDIAGHTGALLSAVTSIPQVYRTWKTKSARDLSLTMMFIVLISTIVWLCYAIALMLWPVILANTIVGLLSILLIYYKFTFKK